MLGRGVIGGIMLAAFVSGCAVVDPVDNRYDNIGRSLAKGRNESIFLNIVRASHDYPLAFTTIGNVTPSMTNTATLGLPSFLVGPNPRCLAAGPAAAACLAVPPTPTRDVIFGNQNNATNGLTVSSNFSITTEETSQFYDGFLKPVDLTVLDYFIRQGYSREMLFWMFADSFQFGPSLGYQYNPPYDYGCPRNEPKQRCFREMVQLAVLLGLSVETRTVDESGGAGGGGGKDGGGNSSSASAKGTKGTKVYSRFCFDKILAQRAQAAMLQVDPERLKELQTFKDQYAASPTPACGGTDWKPETTSAGETDTLTFQLGPVKVSIQPRSAYSMFEFLGNLIKMQRDQQPEIAPAYVPRREELGPPTLATVADDKYLFTVTQNITGDCFVHTWFNDGDYCVPEGAANTKRIFSMLAQLIAIQTQASDLSITPTVRVIQ